MSISAADVNKLRQMTGAGMMDCKKALTEANGDFEAAIDNLRKKGQKVAASRADRETTEGIVMIKTNDSNTLAVLVALGCETDFVAKNDDFRKFADGIAQAAFDKKPADTEALMALSYDGTTVGEKLIEQTGKIGEKISVISYDVMEADRVATYIHSNAKVGVVVGFNGVNGTDLTETGKDIALQIASMKPVAVDKDGVDASVVEREIEIGKEQARAEGKPEAMLEKIALGKLNKFYQDNTLLNQSFVKDGSLTIRQLLEKSSKGLVVKGFKRVAIG